jgi:hypothetical protein
MTADGKKTRSSSMAVMSLRYNRVYLNAAQTR